MPPEGSAINQRRDNQQPSGTMPPSGSAATIWIKKPTLCAVCWDEYAYTFKQCMAMSVEGVKRDRAQSTGDPGNGTQRERAFGVDR
jgi:hypothetical protein